MKKSTFLAISFYTLFSHTGFAGTKTTVEYGVVQESHLSAAPTQHHPLRTLAAGAAGGVVGHQFGNGKGNTAMTVAGAAVGAGVAHRQQEAQQVELTIKTDSGQIIQVTQTNLPQLSFHPGDKVRILTSGTSSSVDKSV